METDTRVEETLKEFVQADLKLKSVVDAVQSDGELSCRALRELVDLEVEARECIKTMRKLLLRLESLAGEEDNEIRRAAFMRNVENYASQLHQSQLHLRKAVLAAKKRLEINERQDVLSGSSDSLRRRRQGDQTTSGSRSSALAAEVTDEMRSLSSMLAGSVESSKNTMDELLQSSSNITETRREYQNMSEHIERSSRLLTKLNRREMTDRVILILAFIFFFITCAYVVKKRMFGSSTATVASTADNPATGTSGTV